MPCTKSDREISIVTSDVLNCEGRDDLNLLHKFVVSGLVHKRLSFSGEA